MPPPRKPPWKPPPPKPPPWKPPPKPPPWPPPMPPPPPPPWPPPTPPPPRANPIVCATRPTEPRANNTLTVYRNTISLLRDHVSQNSYHNPSVKEPQPHPTTA